MQRACSINSISFIQFLPPQMIVQTLTSVRHGTVQSTAKNVAKKQKGAVPPSGTYLQVTIDD